MTYILGISAYYHDSAAAIIKDGNVIAAVQQERFSRKKHDAQFPKERIQYCLSDAGFSIEDISRIVFYDKPWLKFHRLLHTYISFAPYGIESYLASKLVWIRRKQFLKYTLKNNLLYFLKSKIIPIIAFVEHHRSHAASAYYPNLFRDAVELCFDCVGGWATTTV